MGLRTVEKGPSWHLRASYRYHPQRNNSSAFSSNECIAYGVLRSSAIQSAKAIRQDGSFQLPEPQLPVRGSLPPRPYSKRRYQGALTNRAPLAIRLYYPLVRRFYVSFASGGFLTARTGRSRSCTLCAYTRLRPHHINSLDLVNTYGISSSDRAPQKPFPIKDRRLICHHPTSPSSAFSLPTVAPSSSLTPFPRLPFSQSLLVQTPVPDLFQGSVSS